MYVHPDARIAYLANPRTASRATKEALLPLGFRMIGTHHSGFEEAHKGTAGWLTIATVRNHFDALVSWACHMRVPLEPPTLWLDAVLQLLPSQRALIAGWPEGTLFPHAHSAARVLRYETLGESLNGVLVERGLGPVQVPRVGESDRNRDWRTLYDAQMRDRVFETFGPEMKRYVYPFNNTTVAV